MSGSLDSFLFAFLGDKRPSSARKVHIRRLHDILQISISRDDYPRAKRAWSILVRCKEVDWKEMWRYGLLLLGDGQIQNTATPADGVYVTSAETRVENLRVEYLRKMRMQHPTEVVYFLNLSIVV